MYFMICELLENLRLYGNSSIYLYRDFGRKSKNQNDVIEFSVNEEGKLVVKSKIKVYDRPYWDGSKFDDKAIQYRELDIYQCKENELVSPLSLVMYCSIKGHWSGINADKTKVGDLTKTAKARRKIYNMASRMIANWTPKEITQSIRGDENCTTNMLCYKEMQELPEENLKYVGLAGSFMAGKMAKFATQYRQIEEIWEKTQNAQSIEEHDVIGGEWLTLCEDDHIIEDTIPEKSR